MGYEITITSENTKVFPVHSHNTWEFMCYTDGKGVLRTENEDYPFSPGTVIAVPPGVKHGSASENAFVNICIHADVTLRDKQLIYIKQGSLQQRRLFDMIRELYFAAGKYESVIINLIAALGTLIEITCMSDVSNSKLEYVYNKISENFLKKDFDLTGIIAETGYVDDYFRNIFIKQYGITPKAYLDKLRMEYAQALIKTYGNTLRIYEIAEWCGFADPLYFSRKFRGYFGKSPKEYLKGVIEDEV